MQIRASPFSVSLILLTANVDLMYFDTLIPNIAFVFKSNEVLLIRIAIECFRLSRISMFSGLHPDHHVSGTQQVVSSTLARAKGVCV